MSNKQGASRPTVSSQAAKSARDGRRSSIIGPNSNLERKTNVCRFFPAPLPLFFAGIAVAFAILFFIRHPTLEQWQKFNAFVFIEVAKNLYLPFLICVPIFVLCRRIARVIYLPLALFGVTQFLQFFVYYFSTAAAPLLIFVKPEIVQFLDLHPCPSGEECSIMKDLFDIRHEMDKGAQIWVDDAAFVYIVLIPFLLLESKRFRLTAGGLGYLLFSWILGFDVVLPFFLFALEGQEKSNKAPREIGRYHWLYLLLAVLATASWLPNLLDWVMAVGTVAGQIDAGCRTVIGCRATWAIMGGSFTVGFYTVGQIQVKTSSKVLSFVLTWLMRTMMVILICSNLAAAFATWLFFREFVSPPSFLAAKARPIPLPPSPSPPTIPGTKKTN